MLTTRTEDIHISSSQKTSHHSQLREELDYKCYANCNNDRLNVMSTRDPLHGTKFP